MDQELKQHLEAMESRLGAHFDDRMGKLEERLTEKMRDMQTELLRAFTDASSRPHELV